MDQDLKVLLVSVARTILEWAGEDSPSPSLPQDWPPDISKETPVVTQLAPLETKESPLPRNSSDGPVTVATPLPTLREIASNKGLLDESQGRLDKQELVDLINGTSTPSQTEPAKAGPDWDKLRSYQAAQLKEFCLGYGIELKPSDSRYEFLSLLRTYHEEHPKG